MERKKLSNLLERMSSVIDNMEMKLGRLTRKHNMECACHLCTANNLMMVASNHILSELESTITDE